MSEYAVGYNAFKVGMRLTENPHSDLELRAEWSKGWLSAKKGDPLNFQDCVLLLNWRGWRSINPELCRATMLEF